MKKTAKYVSEDIVELLQFIISLFSTNEGLKFLSALLGTLFESPNTHNGGENEEFDPEIENLFEEISGKRKPSPKIIEEGYALAPICNIADKDIIFNLNKYFALQN